MRTFCLITLLLGAGCSAGGMENLSKRSGAQVDGSSEAGSGVVNDNGGGDDGTDTDDDFKPPHEPANVAGINLTSECVPLTVDQNEGAYAFSCTVYAEDGSAKLPQAMVPDGRFSWQVVNTIDSTVIHHTVEAPASPAAPATVIRLGGAGHYMSPADAVKVTMRFSYVDPNTAEEVVSDHRVAGILAGLQDQLKFRLVINSISNHDPMATVQFIDKMEVKIDGVWQELVFDAVEKTLTVDGQIVGSNAEDDKKDALIFANVRGDFGLMTLPASQFTRFDGASSYDVADGEEPLYLQLDFDEPRSISGFRYNGGDPILNHNVAAGFPDRIRFDVSADGDAWQVVPGSEIDVIGDAESDVMEYFWAGSDL